MQHWLSLRRLDRNMNISLCHNRSPQTNGRRQRPIALFLFIAVTLATETGCGLTGGGIPAGPISISSGGGSSVTLSGDVVLSGTVRLAAPPYSDVTAARVGVQTTSGSVIAAPTPVNGDGTFSFSGMPSGAVVLNVSPSNSTVQPLMLSIDSTGQELVQVVASLLPISATPAAAIMLSADTDTPGLHDDANITAQLSGSNIPGLAPSWVAYGDTGYFSASGPNGQFSAQAAGPCTITAVSGSAVSNLALTVPQPSSFSGLGPAGGGSAGTGSSGSGSSGSGSPGGQSGGSSTIKSRGFH